MKNHYVDYKTASLICGLSRASLAKKAKAGQLDAKIDPSSYPPQWLYSVDDLPRHKRRPYVEQVAKAKGVVYACRSLSIDGRVTDDFKAPAKRICMEQGLLTSSEFETLFDLKVL